jgi:hypothetical protein
MKVPGHGCHVIFLIGDKNTISVINLPINIHTNIDIPTGVSKCHNFVRYNTNNKLTDLQQANMHISTYILISDRKDKMKTIPL